jgi:hypothetical protein
VSTPGTRRRATLAALACVLIASVASSGAATARHAETYPGDVRGPRCGAHWYTGTDNAARFACTSAGYRIAFFKTGQDLSVTHIASTRRMEVSALVRAMPGHDHPLLNPGVGCFRDAHHGWLGQLGSGGRWAIEEYTGDAPLAHGTSAAVKRLAQVNRVVLTCTSTGAKLRLSLRVNGTLVAHDVAAGAAVPIDRFGVWAASESGASLLVSSIVATTT